MSRLQKKLEYFTVGGLTVVTVGAGVMLGATTAMADDSVVDDVNITVPISCTMKGTGNNTHNKDIVNGTYESEIGTTTLKAFCNDNGGFAIYAAGYTGEEIGGENSTKLVNSALQANNTIITGTATSAGSSDVSNWAMMLAANNTGATYPITLDNGFGSYSAVPNEYTKVAHRDQGTDVESVSNAQGSTLTTTYAAYVSRTQPAGTYSGKVIYTMVHPAGHAAPVVCKPSATTADTALCMQDFAGPNHDAIIASMTPGQQYTMKDSRDGKTYTIAKYQTGTDSTTSQPIYDVWMTQNLDLDLTAGTTYTNLDTDLGYNTTTGQYETAAWSPTRSTYAATSTQTHEWCQGGTWNSEYNYCENNATPESYDPGDLYWDSTQLSDWSDWGAYYNSCTWNNGTPECDQNNNPLSTYVSSTGTAQYHLGNYYNWAAALATNDASVYDNSDLVEQSICPAGWTLPRIGNGEDTFYSLWNSEGLANNSYIDANSNNQYDAGETALWTSPLYFAASGSFGGALDGVGYDGGFWSPVAGGSDDARYAYFDVDGGAGPSYGNGRYYGNSVRCIARPVVTSVSEGGGGGGAE